MTKTGSLSFGDPKTRVGLGALLNSNFYGFIRIVCVKGSQKMKNICSNLPLNRSRACSISIRAWAVFDIRGKVCHGPSFENRVLLCLTITGLLVRNLYQSTVIRRPCYLLQTHLMIT